MVCNAGWLRETAPMVACASLSLMLGGFTSRCAGLGTCCRGVACRARNGVSRDSLPCHLGMAYYGP